MRATLWSAFCVSGLAIGLLSTRPVEGQQASNTLSPAESKAGWTLMFDGRSLSGFSPTGEADWKVEDGTITATKNVGFLVTKQMYGNFEFKAEFWPDKSVNSGIFLRCADGTPSAVLCYEVNIFDAHAEFPTGSINNVKTVLPERPKRSTERQWLAPLGVGPVAPGGGRPCTRELTSNVGNWAAAGTSLVSPPGAGPPHPHVAACRSRSATSYIATSGPFGCRVFLQVPGQHG